MVGAEATGLSPPVAGVCLLSGEYWAIIATGMNCVGDGFFMGIGTNEDNPSRRIWKSAPHPVYWVIAASLIVIATTLLVRSDGGGLSNLALGQPIAAEAGSGGVFAFSAELSNGVYGVYMVDMDSQTIWCYEYRGAKKCLRLAAARSFKYDRYLENYNVCDVPPEVVQKMIQDQRAYKLRSSEGEKP